MISIISPVYNVDKYLNRCIDSILVQTYKDWELILVDDGSPDNSRKICDEYAEKDSRIRVLHKSNGGVSSARNYGIEEARGEWIYFLDADDYIELNALETMHKTLTASTIDILIFNVNEFIDEARNQIHKYPLIPNKLYNKKEIEQELIPYACKGSSFVNSPCNKAYRRDIIKKNHIFFQKRVMGEDWLFNVEYLQCINSAIYIDTVLYNYMRNGESASSKYIPEQFKLWTENWQTKMDLIKKYNLNVDIKQMKREMYLKTFYFIRTIKEQDKTELKESRLKKVFHSKQLGEWLTSLPTNLRELRAYCLLLLLHIIH